MENCVAPGLDEFDVLLEVVLSLARVIPVLIHEGLYIFFFSISDF